MQNHLVRKELPMIRPLSEQDFDSYCQIRLEAIENHPIAFSLTPEVFKKASKELLMRSYLAKKEYLVLTLGYFLDNNLVAMVGFKGSKQICFRHTGIYWGFYVKLDFRKKGIGTSLMKESLKIAKLRKEIKTAIIMGPKSHVGVTGMLQSLGFKENFLEKEGIYDGTNYHDQIGMQININQ